ncbi:hypothetical protein GGR54DRAFT_195254 [Hypoxylon sp. NC1633]|nr:hypothetical protein GGR54DRAFT_195254 [Hypoxylon sp. NC1633]
MKGRDTYSLSWHGNIQSGGLSLFSFTPFSEPIIGYIYDRRASMVRHAVRYTGGHLCFFCRRFLRFSCRRFHAALEYLLAYLPLPLSFVWAPKYLHVRTWDSRRVRSWIGWRVVRWFFLSFLSPSMLTGSDKQAWLGLVGLVTLMVTQPVSYS